MTARKTLFAALAAATAVAAIAAPAAAQTYGGYDHQARYEQNRGHDRWNGANSINARLAELRNRIEIGQRRGTLTQREAAQLRNDYASAASLVAHTRLDRATPRQLAAIDRRLDIVEAKVERESRDRDYGYGYGRGHGREYDRR